MRAWLDRLKTWAQAIKRDAVALYLAARDPRVPWYAKVFAAVIAAYALSPIDLIPDFIPVLGYLGEVILLPLAIAGVIRLIDPAIMSEQRTAATDIVMGPVSKLGAACASAPVIDPATLRSALARTALSSCPACG